MTESEDLKKIESYFAFHELFGVSDLVGFKTFKAVKPKVISVQPRPEVKKLELSSSLNELKEELLMFEGCKLKRFARNTVFGEGVSNPKYLIIGEAPGEEEDINGVPFCGRSGRLLERILNQFGIYRDKNAYITNCVFWRPPGNRKPEKDELEACRPFVEKIITILKPEVIIAVGSVPLCNAIDKDYTFADARKKEFEWKFMHEEAIKTKVITLYHPSYLLRNPIKKREVYLDILHFKKQLIIV